MTQPTTEQETRPQSGRGVSGGLSRKIGPLPAWGWAAVAGGAALIWYVWRRNKTSQQAADTTAAAAAAGPIAGTACTDAAGNPGFISANGGCDTSLSGTGLPGGGQDAALLAQIKALQGEESTTQREVTDIQSDVGEPPVRRRRTEEQRETRAQEAAENRTRPRPRRPVPQPRRPRPGPRT